MRVLPRWGLAAIAVALVAASPGRAKAGMTLTFNGQPTGPFTSIVEQGFRLTWVGFGDQQAVADIGGGNQALVDSNPTNVFGAEVTIARVNGGTFNLDSLQVANLANLSNPFHVAPGSGFRIQLTGSNGAIAAFGPGSSTLSTRNFTRFNGLTSVNLNIVSSSGFADFAVDNINVSAVPEPSSLSLIAGGVVVVGAFARRPRRRLA